VTQGDLPFVGPGGIWPAVDPVYAARVFVDQVKARRVCRRCCRDDGLVFVHRRAYTRWDCPVARLVQLGAGATRLREEMGKCDVLCRRCALAKVAPQMLRCHGRTPVGIVAKVGRRAKPLRVGGENALLSNSAKGAEFTPRSSNVA
jgi:hypothetical protein